MAVEFGVFVPQGWRMDLVEIEDPHEQYEAMTRVAKVAEESGGEAAHRGLPHPPTAPPPPKKDRLLRWAAPPRRSPRPPRANIQQLVT